MKYDCSKERADFLDRNWRFVGRVVAVYCGLSIWGIVYGDGKSPTNPYPGLFFAGFFVFLLYAILSELQQANGHSPSGRAYRWVITKFHRRTATSEIVSLEERLNRGQFVALAIPAVAGLGFVFPASAYPVSFLIGLLASRLGFYFWEEEIKSPKKHRMPVTTIFSALIFVAFMGLAWLLNVFGMEFSVSNSSLPFFVAGLANWFAIGFIGQLVISVVEDCWLRKRV